MCGWMLYQHRVWNDITRVRRASRSVQPYLHNLRLCPSITTCPWFMSVNQSCLGMMPHEHLDRSCSFAHHVGHSIGLSSVSTFLRMSAPFNRPIQHVWMGSVSAMSVNQSCLGMMPHRPNNISIYSAIFAHHVSHSIDLTSVPPFLHTMLAAVQ